MKFNIILIGLLGLTVLLFGCPQNTISGPVCGDQVCNVGEENNCSLDCSVQASPENQQVQTPSVEAKKTENPIVQPVPEKIPLENIPIETIPVENTIIEQIQSTPKVEIFAPEFVNQDSKFITLFKISDFNPIKQASLIINGVETKLIENNEVLPDINCMFETKLNAEFEKTFDCNSTVKLSIDSNINVKAVNEFEKESDLNKLVIVNPTISSSASGGAMAPPSSIYFNLTNNTIHYGEKNAEGVIEYFDLPLYIESSFSLDEVSGNQIGSFEINGKNFDYIIYPTQILINGVNYYTVNFKDSTNQNNWHSLFLNKNLLTFAPLNLFLPNAANYYTMVDLDSKKLFFVLRYSEFADPEFSNHKIIFQGTSNYDDLEKNSSNGAIFYVPDNSSFSNYGGNADDSKYLIAEIRNEYSYYDTITKTVNWAIYHINHINTSTNTQIKLPTRFYVNFYNYNNNYLAPVSLGINFSCYNPYKTVKSCSIDFGDETPIVTGTYAYKYFTNPGSYDITLSALIPAPFTGIPNQKPTIVTKKISTINVLPNNPPTITVSDIIPANPKVNEVFSFDISCSDPERLLKNCYFYVYTECSVISGASNISDNMYYYINNNNSKVEMKCSKYSTYHFTFNAYDTSNLGFSVTRAIKVS